MPNTLPLPGLLPAKFEKYANFRSDQELFEALVQDPHELASFFGHAVEDETWSVRDHAEFTKLVLRWFEKKSLERKLPLEFIYNVADIIQEHAHTLASFVAKDLTIHLKGGDMNASALLMMASSDILREQIDAYCEGGNNPHLTFNVPRDYFKIFDEYFVKERVEELWHESPDTLHKIMDQARNWDLEELAILCEDVLKRYIDRTNVFEQLLTAHANRWPRLKNGCIDYINQMNLGIHLERGAPDQLICQLQDLKFHTVDNYSNIKAAVTRLMFRGKIPEETGFIEVIRETPKLNSLDLSDTDSYAAAYSELPSNLDELILNRCAWLNSSTLGRLFNTCPSITKLQLVSNRQLDINALATLQQLKRLTSLNLARCSLNDTALQVTLAAARRLEELNVNECTEISAFGFTELARSIPELIYLYASKTEIDDGSLAELGMHCKRLMLLDVSRSMNVTFKGVQELVRLCPRLKSIQLSGCPISNASIQELRDFNRKIAFSL